ncbi:MAG: MGH1-like glycoside hydrolase domain-containing protein [Armatimonadota bacterium]
MILPAPEFITDSNDVNRAFRFALADIYCNVHPYKAGLINGEPVLCAGFDYPDPWTRDTAINIYNGVSMLFPKVAKNNLLATITSKDGELMLRDAPGSPEEALNYWDAIIWVIGIWHYYVYTGDRSLLQIALDVTKRAFETFESLEYDDDTGLFRGGAVYGDGIAAYPDAYAEPELKHSDIAGWPARNPHRAYPKGTGLPMCSLSTNCVYAEAYRLAACIAREFDDEIAETWDSKSANLKATINEAFWIEEKGTYGYLVDTFGGSDHQEGLGISLAILFGVTNPEETARILDSAYITPQGIACVWPTFPRYAVNDTTFGRHSGTVWPFIQAFWAQAALSGDRKDLFDNEFMSLTRLAVKSDGFYEIYHPVTGEPYGGVQEGINWRTWDSVPRQTWSATGYLKMVVSGILGMRFSVDGVSFHPSMPAGIHSASMKNLSYRNMTLNVSITGSGDKVKSLTINGEKQYFLPGDSVGIQDIQIGLIED